MSKENKEEKLFNERVDRILAGEPVQIDADDKDMQTALEFAKKMEQLRTSPALPFKANLKAKLLQTLREKEAKVKKGNWWTRTFPKRIAWQLGTTVAVILLAIGISWQSGVFQPDDITNVTAMPPKAVNDGTLESTPGPSLMATDGNGTDTTSAFATSGRQGAVIQANAVTDKANYLPGEAVVITIFLTNNSADSIEIQQYPPVLDINDGYGNVVYSFGAGNGTIVLQSGETSDYKVVWYQIDSSNNAGLSGTYYLAVNSIANVSNLGVSNSVSSFNISP